MEWLQSKLDEVITLPHEAILLRWTAAIKEKAEKLLGNADKGIAGYIDKGVVGAEDSYVVAINGRLLRGQSCFASINLGLLRRSYGKFRRANCGSHLTRRRRKADSNSWSHFEKSRPSQDTRDGNGRPPQLRPRPDLVTPPFRAGDQNGDQRDGFVCRET
jgi:hypothetical protein